MTSRARDLRIGISSWRYGPWRGVFDPKGLTQKNDLNFASGMVRTAEINSSFYSLPRPSSDLCWYHETPDDFVFAVRHGGQVAAPRGRDLGLRTP